MHLIIKNRYKNDVGSSDPTYPMQLGRILIADDDAVVRLDLRAILETLGYCVVGEADNGESAINLARTLKPDLIILDVMMPQKNGIQAAEAINKERLGPVLLLTAYSDAPIIEQAKKAGVVAYLVKPFRQQDIQPAIEVAISRYREMSALEGALETIQSQVELNRIIGRAKRVLMERYAISDQEAYRRIQSQALTNNREVREIAEAILLTENITMPSDKMRTP